VPADEHISAVVLVTVAHVALYVVGPLLHCRAAWAGCIVTNATRILAAEGARAPRRGGQLDLHGGVLLTKKMKVVTLFVL
jgi:hypothetical protein